MRERRLAVLARFGDVVSADTLVAFLASREIDAYVDGVDPLSLGLGSRVRVVLAEDDLRRARWALESAAVSESELWLAATGELDPEAARQAFSRDPTTGSTFTARIAGWIAGALVLAFLVAALLSR